MSDFKRATLFFATIIFSFLLFSPSWSRSQENGEWDSVPDGSFEQIREFEKKLSDERRRRNKEFSEKYSKGEIKDQDRDEYQKFNDKWDDLQKEIVEKILALPELSKEAKQHAYSLKWMIARRGSYLHESIPKLEAFMEECGDDPDLAKAKNSAFRDWLRNSVLSTQSVEGLDTLFEKLLDHFKTDEQSAVYSCETFFQKLADMPPEQVGDRAESYFQRIKEVLVNSEDEKIREFLSKLEGQQRFHTLTGKEMELKGITLDEKTLDLSDLKGKIVYVDFWATWCGPCIGEMPELHETYKILRDAGFEVISYSIDKDRDELISFHEEHKYTWPVISVLDSKEKEFLDYYEYYGGGYVPKTALIGRDGKVIQTDIRGYLLKRKLEELFAEEYQKKIDDPSVPVSAKIDFYSQKLMREWSDEILEKSIPLLLEHKNESVPNLRSMADMLYHAHYVRSISHENGEAEFLSFAKKMQNELKDAKNENLKDFFVQMENTVRRLELPGQPMEFEAVFLDGEQRKLADFQGKPVLIGMFQHLTLPPGMDETTHRGSLPPFLENLQKIDELYSDKLTVLVYMFNTPEKPISQIKQFIPEKNIATIEASTDKGLKNYWTYYGVRGTPTWFLVDSSGKVVKLERGKGIVNLVKEFLENQE